MKELRFRAWDAKKKSMYNVHYLEWPLAGGNWESAKGSQADTNGEYWMTNLLPRKDTLMQFTGLKDKNGKECFENDLVKDHQTGNIYPVVWHEGGFWLEHPNGNHFWPDENNREVIGNVYEPPEVIKP